MSNDVKHKATEECLQCKKLFEFESAYCCDGREYGCYGRPIDPPLCSSECWDKFFPPSDPSDFPPSDDSGEIPF